MLFVLAIITLNKPTTCCICGIYAYYGLIKPLYHIKCIRTVIKCIILARANGRSVDRRSGKRPPPLTQKTIREIDTRYHVICLAVITLNKHTTCCLDGVYATGVHTIS